MPAIANCEDEGLEERVMLGAADVLMARHANRWKMAVKVTLLGSWAIRAIGWHGTSYSFFKFISFTVRFLASP